MLWSEKNRYVLKPFAKEVDLEAAIEVVKGTLFGPNRVYLETKKLLGARGKNSKYP